MKKIALISPKPKFQFSNNNELYEFFINTDGHHSSIDSWWRGFNPAILLLASYVDKQIFEIDVIDEVYEDIDFNKHYDLVAISAMTQLSERGYEIAEIFRSKQSTVIMGGTHASVMPEEAMQFVDAVVIGEGEVLFPEILNDYLNGRLKQRYLNSNKIDISRLKPQCFEYIPSDYNHLFFIQTSRGCPHDCDFCAASSLYGKKQRYRDIENVIEEIEHLNKFFDKPRILFADDNIFLNKKRAFELINALKEVRIANWRVQTDISVAFDDELLEKMKDSNCTSIFIGFESVNKNSLLKVNRSQYKYNNFEQYKNAISNIQKYGIGVIGAFIVGFDDDTSSIFQDTIDFIVESRLATAQITVLTPLPGTRLYERMKEENRLLNSTWSNYTGWDVNILHPSMNKNEIDKGIVQIYETIYGEAHNQERLRNLIEIFKKGKRKG